MKKQKKSIEIGKKVSQKELIKMHALAGGSNVGEYSHVSPKNFAGTAGGAPAGSYPINTRQRAIAALRYAHYAKNPQGIKEAVYKKYPSLRPEKNK